LALVTLKHLTSYLYQQPVALGPHRMMVRPRESFDQYLVEATLEITPKPSKLRWLQDVFGNAVAIAEFDQRARELRILSTIAILHTPLDPSETHVETYAQRYPFTYASEDMPDLLRSIERNHYDPARLVDSWARQFVRAKGSTGTLRMLRQMTANIHDQFTYVARHEKGTQTPMETLAKRRGTCRDFAVLMIEAARALGLAARFVSGYLYDPTRHEPMIGGGNTHAWVRIFLPGSGWVEFDPTNGIVGNRGLIRVAVARDPQQAVPISGTWRGFPSDNLGLKVTVDVHCPDDGSPPSKREAPGPRSRSSTEASPAPSRRSAEVAGSAGEVANADQGPSRADDKRFDRGSPASVRMGR
jgi:transglutaminase-like putative cysteine protease